jgi:phage terminase large subunit
MKARDPEVLLAGPAGTGKSRACLEKLHLMALANPGMRGLIVRKTATTLSSTALVTWQKFVAVEAIEQGVVRFYGGSAQEPPSYKYKNKSVVAIGGMDNASKIMSSEYDVIYVQEATELTENDWEALTTRLRNWRVSFQQLMADCNPSSPTHWLK